MVTKMLIFGKIVTKMLLLAFYLHVKKSLRSLVLGEVYFFLSCL